MPFFVLTSSINFIDSSEISKPKEGNSRNFGVGKNLLNEFIDIIILYDILTYLAIILLCPCPGRNFIVWFKQRKLTIFGGNCQYHPLTFNSTNHSCFQISNKHAFFTD